jgi:hypothetical protein
MTRLFAPDPTLGKIDIMTKALSSTAHLFGRKPANKGTLTSESISADLRAFQLAGGTIEKLGNTSTLKHIPATQPVQADPVRSLGRAKAAVS